VKVQFYGQHTRQFVKQFPGIFLRFQKKTFEKTEPEQTIVTDSRRYKVDGEVGRFEFATHSVVDEKGGIQFDSAVDIFPVLKAKAFYRTIGLKEIAFIYGNTENSFRKTIALINRIRYQEKDGTPYRTLQENTEKEGADLIDYIANKTKSILIQNNFTEEGCYQGHNQTYLKNKPITLAKEKVIRAGETFSDNYAVSDILNNPVYYEDPERTVNISIDDVNVKKQEETRQKEDIPKEPKRKYVHNTVIHVGKGQESYTLNGYGMKTVLSYLIAFLFNNRLTGNRFQFFTDGHTTLNKAIIKSFSWYKNLGIILDWYHLEKKCKEQLSMALKGSKIRNQVLKQLMPILWHGITDKGILLLEEIDGALIKNEKILSKLIEYLKRNKPYIPCYAVRKELGLRNSSNIGEKMNDLVVSNRQKHNGMSWSKDGSIALASITALKRNNESKKWFREKKLRFRLAA